MIDVKSLMIGNWVIYENKYIQVESIDGITINQEFFGGQICFDIKMDELSPIPLTPEILEKCGFKKHKNSNEYWTFWILPNEWRINQSHHNEPSAGVESGKFYWGEEYIEMTSLHHLQNFYFCHTGKELEVKL